MAVPMNFVAREAGSNLWRNRLMTVAAILTVAVSLSLVGAALFLRQGVSNATTEWQHGVSVIVWFHPSSSITEQRAVGDELTQLSYVKSCTYRTQTDNYNQGKRYLNGLLGSASSAVTPAVTPASDNCVLKNPDEAGAIAAAFRNQPGVRNVSYPSQAIHNMENITRTVQLAFLIVALVLLASASALIVNTIRLAIFSRRKEVSVMKLVGATNWFIRIPFMLEGLVQGVAGAVVAGLVVLGLNWRLNAASAGHFTSTLYKMRLTGGEVVLIIVAVGIVGLLVGTLGSAFAIRRFLDT
ncbi:MAG: ABC transporter permease [Actinobacteria bacterium]|nr:ABC transporter permease [Actinomycetota bacterium]